MQWTTQNDLKHYKVLVTPNVLAVSPSSKFYSILLYDHPFFRATCHFKTSAPNAPQNDLGPYKIKCTPKYVLLLSPTPNFSPFHSMASYFESQAILKKSEPNDPKLTLNHTRSKVPHICVLLVSTSRDFHSVSLYDQPFLRCRPFGKKCYVWPQNDLEPYKVKCTT